MSAVVSVRNFIRDPLTFSMTLIQMPDPVSRLFSVLPALGGIFHALGVVFDLTRTPSKEIAISNTESRRLVLQAG